MSKSPKYWVTLLYKLFLTYDEVNDEFQSTTRATGVRNNVPSAESDEPQVERETPKRRVSYRRPRVS